MKYIRTLLVTAALVLLTACGKADSEPDTLLTIGRLYTRDSLPIVVADKLGLFQEEGLNVKIFPFQSAMERDSAFQAGKVDAITCDLVGCSLMKLSGSDLRIPILTMGHIRGHGRVAILSSPNSGISSVSQLPGVPIGISQNTVLEYITDQLLMSAGLEHEQITKTSVAKIPVRLNMLLEDQIPAAALPDPLATFAVSHGAHVIIDDANDNVSQAVIALRGAVIDERRDVVEALVRAFNRAVDAIAKDPDSFEDLLADCVRLPKDMETRFLVEPYPRDTLPSLAQFERVKGWLQLKGFDVDSIAYEDLIDASFVCQE